MLAKRGRRSGVAFTLIELLVVVAIVAMLIAMVLPALGGAMEASRTAQCASNQRQWGIAAHLYMAEHDNYLPFDRHLVGTSAAGDTTPGIWFNELPLYVGAPRYGQAYTGSAGTKQYPNAHIWWCPSDRVRFGTGGVTASGNAFDYSMNEVLDGTNTRGPNYGAGATPAHMSHVNAQSIPDPTLTLLISERNTRVETLSIGTVDLDRHTDEFVNIVFMDAHVGRYHGRKANQVSSGSSTAGDYWMTHDDELIWGAFP